MVGEEAQRPLGGAAPLAGCHGPTGTLAFLLQGSEGPEVTSVLRIPRLLCSKG